MTSDKVAMKIKDIDSSIKKIAVIGGSRIERKSGIYDMAYEVGKNIAGKGAILVCGGLSGVMEAACRGAQSGKAGTADRRAPIVAVLPGYDKADANPYVEIVITTGMGYARNSVIASSADAVIAVSGGSGTLSEVAFAWQYGKPIVIIRNLPGIPGELIDRALDERRKDRILGAESPREAVRIVESLLGP